jgi:hypothetical protein
MNLKLLSAFAALSIFGFAAAEEKLTIEVEENLINPRCSVPTSPEDKCTWELEGIVYQPQTAARFYLDKISEQIKCAGPILWSSQAISYIQNFEARYNVMVTIRDPFRNIEYPIITDRKTAIVDTGKNYLSTTSTANMNASGFAVVTGGDEVVLYEFIVFNPYGELKYVLITLPLSEAPAEFGGI